VDKSRVVSEAPYSYPQRRHRTLFEREMLYANLDNHPHDNSLAQLRVFQERESLATDLREICDDSTRGRAYMSPTIYRDSGYTLMHLIEEIRHGKIALPDIQRPFVLRLRDLLDPEASSPRSVERHHLFPKAHLKAKGITGRRSVNAIANMAYLDWPDNSHIAPDDPLTYWPAMTEGLDPERLRRQAYWHALPVGWEQLDYATFLERRRTLLAQVVRDGFSTLWEDSEPEPTKGVAGLLRVGESQTVEFKSTARWNVYASKPDKKMEHVITKTICGFLNAQGGKLLIGVDDDGNVVGLDADLQTFRKGNKDGYELFLRQLLDENLSVPTAGDEGHRSAMPQMRIRLSCRGSRLLIQDSHRETPWALGTAC